MAKIIAASIAPIGVDGGHVIATAKMALDAAALAARRLGVEPLILGDTIEGEAREVGIVMAGIAAGEGLATAWIAEVVA